MPAGTNSYQTVKNTCKEAEAAAGAVAAAKGLSALPFTSFTLPTTGTWYAKWYAKWYAR